MEDNIGDKLAQLESQVAAIKDTTLRRIAFEKLLDSIVQPTAISRISGAQKKQKGSAIKATKKSGVRNKASAFYSVNQVREVVQKLTLTGTVNGLANFRDIGTGWKSYLWVLAAAKRSKIDGLNNHEIAYILTKRLYKPTKYSTVNNIHKKVGSGFVCQDPETQRWMITPDGETHLMSVAGK
jgi:hypothetical protein